MEVKLLFGMGMIFWIPAVVVAVIAYFCGCFNGAVIASKFVLKDDVRNHGSGNAGLTNFYRVFGAKYAALVLLSDMLKAVVAVLIGALVAKHFWMADAVVIAFGKYWGAVFCLLGHMYPCVFEFKGGKGVLSGGTAALMIDWRVALVVWGGFLILVILTRWVSLGSVYAGVSFPIVTWFVYHDPVVLILGIICGGLLVWRHRANIGRLVKGTESKLAFGKKKEGA